MFVHVILLVFCVISAECCFAVPEFSGQIVQCTEDNYGRFDCDIEVAATYVLSVSSGACAKLNFSHFSDENGTVYIPFGEVTATHGITSLSFVATSEYSYLTRPTQDTGISQFCGCLDDSHSACQVGGQYCQAAGGAPSYSFSYRIRDLSCIINSGGFCGCAYAFYSFPDISIDFCNDISYQAVNSLSWQETNFGTGTQGTFSENLNELVLQANGLSITLFQDGVFQFPDTGIENTFVAGSGTDVHILAEANDITTYDNSLAGWYKSEDGVNWVYSQTEFTNANTVNPQGCHPPTSEVSEGSVNTASLLDSSNLIQFWLTNGYTIQSYSLNPLNLVLVYSSGIQTQYTMIGNSSSVTFIQTVAQAIPKFAVIFHICESDSYDGNVTLDNIGQSGQVFVHVGNPTEDHVVASVQVPVGVSVINFGGQLKSFNSTQVCVYSDMVRCATPLVVCQQEQFPSTNSDREVTGKGGGVGDFLESNSNTILIIVIVLVIVVALCFFTFVCFRCCENR